jgi:branched-chain amino acid transport system substrate-binding protein
MSHSAVARGPILVLAALLAGFPSAGRSADPYQIDAIVSLTGQVAFIGQSQAQTLRAIEDTVNKSGGIGGRPLKIVISDDQSTPRVAVQLATQAIANKDNVIFGPGFTANCNAVLPLLKDGPFEYCLSPGIHPTSGFAFSASVSTGDLVAAGIRYFRLRGWTRLAVIIATDASGQDVEHGIRVALALPENKTMDVVAFEHFNPTDLSVAAQMSNIKTAKPQVLITWGTGTPEGTLLRGVADAALDIPVFTSAANLTYAQMKTYGDFLPKQMLFPGSPVLVPDQLPRGAVKNSVMQFLKAFENSGIRPDIGQAIAWDPVIIVIDALRKLGTNATPQQIRDYVANMHGWSGISGVYDFRAVPQRGIDINAVMIVRWDPAKGTWVGVSKFGGIPL